MGIRKTVGSTRGQLIRQFLVETTFLSFLAVLLALVFVSLFIDTFNIMSGKFLEFSLLSNPINILAIFGLIIIIGLMAGTYPAFFLVSFQPASVLRREKSKNSRRSWTRSVLVVFQFAVSIVLIIGTLIVRNQMDYTRTADLGFNKDNVIIVKKTDDLADNLRPFKLALLENASVVSATNTGNLMGQPFGNSVFIIPGETGEETHLLWTFTSDPDFVKTYQIKLVNGRYFEEGRETDMQACVINESAVSTLGFKDPIGKEIQTPSEPRQTLKILGVVKDFHFESLHQKIRPMIIFPFQQDLRGRFLSVRIQPNTLTSARSDIEQTWRKFAKNQAFEYEVFEDHFARIYLPEEKTAGILFSFSILAIIIASLGLFGLAAFIAEQRTKEIGVRKVLGATITGVVLLLTKQFTKWVIIANIIAWPVAWFVMDKWQQNFAYQAPFTLTVFFYSAVIALLIAILTVSYQSIKAAIANPVESLRYE